MLRTTIDLERDEVGLETTKIWGSVTMTTGDLPESFETLVPKARRDFEKRSFDVFVLLDAGVDVQNNKLRGIKESIASILSSLDDQSTFSLVVYNLDLELIISFMVCTSENKLRIMDQLDRISPRSSANHYLGLRTVFDLVAKSSKIPALFFFSSGMTEDPRQVTMIKEIAPIRGCTFHVIGLGTTQNSKLLYGISHHLRGIYHYAPTPLETYLATSRCMTNLLSTFITELTITLECFSGCRVVSWSTPFEIVEKRLAKTYEAHSLVCSANETRTFIFGLSLKSMIDLEKVDYKTGKVPMIWFNHPLATIKVSYLNLATGKRESTEKNLSVLRVRFPGYFPLDDHLKKHLERLETIETLNKYIKDLNPVLLTQLPDNVKKEFLTLKGLHKNHSICAYASSRFFEKFV